MSNQLYNGCNCNCALRMHCRGHAGGKKKPLKAPKKEKGELGEEDIAFKQKLQAEQKALKEAAAKAKNGPIGQGKNKITGKK